MDQFYQEMMKILNVLLRMNKNEAITEILITNRAISLLSDDFDQFLHVNFAEELINRKTVKIIDENIDKNPKNLINGNFNKNHRRNYMKPISRIPRLFLGFFTYIMIFSFLFFTYFYWNMVNDEINTLIDTTNFFQNLYTLPGSIILCKNLIFRDKLIKNQFSTQINTEEKVSNLYELLLNLTKEIKKTNILIPKYALPAENLIKNQNFSTIIQGNICEVILYEGFIDESEKKLCEKIYNGVFTKGLLAISNEFANIDNYYSAILSENSDFSQILSLILEDSIAIDVMAIIFIDNAMEIFYRNIEIYHKNAMFIEQNNLQIMLIITTVFIGGGLVVGMWFYAIFLKKMYRNVSMTLSLIPYERLMNDEQTVFLIKKFWKN